MNRLLAAPLVALTLVSVACAGSTGKSAMLRPGSADPTTTSTPSGGPDVAADKAAAVAAALTLSDLPRGWTSKPRNGDSRASAAEADAAACLGVPAARLSTHTPASSDSPDFRSPDGTETLSSNVSYLATVEAAQARFSLIDGPKVPECMGGAQIGKGLYGPLEIVPKKGDDIPAAHDYSLMFADTNLGFVLNGKSYPDTTPLHAKVGEKVHIRIYDPGDDEHSVHLHGLQFQVVAQDGHLLPQPYYADTIDISPGQTYDIVAVETYPGKWALHCHKFIHSENGMGMMGMTTVLDVAP